MVKENLQLANGLISSIDPPTTMSHCDFKKEEKEREKLQAGSAEHQGKMSLSDSVPECLEVEMGMNHSRAVRLILVQHLHRCFAGTAHSPLTPPLHACPFSRQSIPLSPASSELLPTHHSQCCFPSPPPLVTLTPPSKWPPGEESTHCGW